MTPARPSLGAAGEPPRRRPSGEPGPLFVVASSVDAAAAGEWNRWYDETHLEEVMGASESIASATRYRRRYGGLADDYLAVYAFDHRDGLERFVRDEALRAMADDFDRRWGSVSRFDWGAYLPVASRRR